MRDDNYNELYTISLKEMRDDNYTQSHCIEENDQLTSSIAVYENNDRNKDHTVQSRHENIVTHTH